MPRTRGPAPRAAGARARRADRAPGADLLSVALWLLRELTSTSRSGDTWAGTSYQQFGALLAISRAGSASQAELARILRVTPPAVTRLVAALAHAKLVERGSHPADGRAVLVSLTAVGRTQLDQMQRDLAAATEELLEGLDPTERVQVDNAVELLGRLQARV